MLFYSDKESFDYLKVLFLHNVSRSFQSSSSNCILIAVVHIITADSLFIFAI